MKIEYRADNDEHYDTATQAQLVDVITATDSGVFIERYALKSLVKLLDSKFSIFPKPEMKNPNKDEEDHFQ